MTRVSLLEPIEIKVNLSGLNYFKLKDSDCVIITACRYCEFVV